MKKILFSLVALVCSMSMNAQVIKILKNGEVVKTYTAAEADEVVFEEAPEFPTTGTAKRTGNIDVNWVQLWENGPKFAEYNVGASSATGNGGYYFWGGSIDKDTSVTYKSSDGDLTGTYDTATKLWGSEWRMPTKAELDALLAKCNVEWTDNYKGSGAKGRIYTGKDDYASNSVFLPVAGYYAPDELHDTTTYGYYWSSTHNDAYGAYYLLIGAGGQKVEGEYRTNGYSVRAVLAE